MTSAVASPPGTVARRLPYPLRVFCIVTLSATALAWLSVLIASVKHLGYPYDWPFFAPGASLVDFAVYFFRFKTLLHHADFYTHPGHRFSYMAPTVLLYRALYIYSLPVSITLYLIASVGAVVLGAAGLRDAMLRRGIRTFAVDDFVFVLALTSFPAAYCIERGNIEILITAGLALGIWAYWKDRTWLAAILWGVFGSFKLFPLVLLALFLSFRQYRQFLLGIVTAVGSILLSILYIGPDFHTAWAGNAEALGLFVRSYTLRPVIAGVDHSLGIDHSLFILLRLLSHASPHLLEPLLRVYTFAVAAGMLTLYFLRIRALPAANQLLILSISSVLLPPTSFEYTLTQLYAPFAVLVFLAIAGARRLTAAFVLFALLFTPLNLAYFQGQSASGLFKCLLLLALLTLSSVVPFEEHRGTESRDTMHDQPAGALA